jgi:hypothetical protein
MGSLTGCGTSVTASMSQDLSVAAVSSWPISQD